MKRIYPFALLAGSLLLAGAAIAESPDGPRHHGPGHHGKMGEHFFERMDLNKDGKVTKDEIAKAHADHFAEISGGAATISQQQFADFEIKRDRSRAEDKFKRMDKNGDGTLQASEFDRPHDRMFARMDKNGDGAITRDEMSHGEPDDHPGRP